jgi:hypothetical protein
MYQIRNIDGWRLKWLLMTVPLAITIIGYVVYKYSFYELFTDSSLLWATLKVFVLWSVSIYFICDLYTHFITRSN